MVVDAILNKTCLPCQAVEAGLDGTWTDRTLFERIIRAWSSTIFAGSIHYTSALLAGSFCIFSSMQGPQRPGARAFDNTMIFVVIEVDDTLRRSSVMLGREKYGDMTIA